MRASPTACRIVVNLVCLYLSAYMFVCVPGTEACLHCNNMGGGGIFAQIAGLICIWDRVRIQLYGTYWRVLYYCVTPRYSNVHS